MFYYLTVSYDIHDLSLVESSYLAGPFDTAASRDEELKGDLSKRDLEMSETVNVTLLKIEDGKLVSEKSFVPSFEDYPHDDNDDDDNDD